MWPSVTLRALARSWEREMVWFWLMVRLARQVRKLIELLEIRYGAFSEGVWGVGRISEMVAWWVFLMILMSLRLATR